MEVWTNNDLTSIKIPVEFFIHNYNAIPLTENVKLIYMFDMGNG